MNYTISNFELLRRLGDGSYSEVVLAKHKDTGVEYALKIIDKYHIVRHNAVNQVKKERNILEYIDNPGVVKLYFTFQDSVNLYLGLEACSNGELYDQIREQGSLTLKDAVHYAAEIVLMLECLRDHDVVHRDLKPENILLDRTGHLKLVDFGTAKELTKDTPDRAPDSKECDESPGKETNNRIARDKLGELRFGCGSSSAGRKMSLVGTAEYVAPEVLRNSGEVGPAIDLWALGCVIYQMLTGRTPFNGITEYLTFQNIMKGEFEPLPDRCGKDAQDIVKQLLSADPNDRIGVKHLEELKSHKFFTGVRWDRIREEDAPCFTKLVEESTESGGTSSFDWELRSLAAALPRIGKDTDHVDV